jgi:hypothetical protein
VPARFVAVGPQGLSAQVTKYSYTTMLFNTFDSLATFTRTYQLHVSVSVSMSE